MGKLSDDMGLRLRPAARRILAFLEVKERASLAELIDASQMKASSPQHQRDTIKVQVCLIRTAIRERGMTIVSLWGSGGYALSSITLAEAGLFDDEISAGHYAAARKGVELRKRKYERRAA